MEKKSVFCRLRTTNLMSKGAYTCRRTLFVLPVGWVFAARGCLTLSIVLSLSPLLICERDSIAVCSHGNRNKFTFPDHYSDVFGAVFSG